MSVDDDAREFGLHFKQGGWRLGLLVARNVEPGKGQGKLRPPVDEAESEQDSPKPEKVSSSRFADIAGVTKQTVAYYYKAWQLAADDGKCQHAESLSPGDEDLDEIEEDDEHTREDWSTYLRRAKVPHGPKEPSAHQGTGAAERDTSVESGPKAEKTPQAQLNRAIQQVSDDTERLTDHLGKLIPNVSLSTKGSFAGLAQDLRAAREALEKQCDLIDQLLAFIEYGDHDLEDEAKVTKEID